MILDKLVADSLKRGGFTLLERESDPGPRRAEAGGPRKRPAGFCSAGRDLGYASNGGSPLEKNFGLRSGVIKTF